MTEPAQIEETAQNRKIKTIPGIGLPAGSDYPNLEEIPSEPCTEVFWRKEVTNAFETAKNGYSFYRIAQFLAVFAKDLSGYWYKLNNATRCFEFLFEGFKDTTDYTRINLPPQAPTFVGFNIFHQAVFPMNEDGRPILPKDDRGKTIFPYYDNYPLFPVDDSGAICVPLGDDGNPAFPRIPEEFGAYVPCDITGRVVLPIDEKGEPIYPRDETGNVLMPFIILDDGNRKRAVYCAEDGTPILPFHNGEHALEVHEGEVLFQYEYQQKMMLLAQFPAKKEPEHRQLMTEEFYQQHAAQYQNQMENPQISPEIVRKSAENPAKSTNLLLKQLSFMKKKKQEEATPTSTVSSPMSTVIPKERPAKPNKEKERGGIYVPEPSRRQGSFRRDFDHRSHDRSRRPERQSRRSRSRSLTYSPIRERRSGSAEKKRKHKRRRRDSSASSKSSSGTDYDNDHRQKKRGESSRKSGKIR